MIYSPKQKNPTLLPTIDSGSNNIAEDENAKRILRSAFLLTKSVPRATNITNCVWMKKNSSPKLMTKVYLSWRNMEEFNTL